MEKVRINNDLLVKYTVFRDGLPESFAGATDITVTVTNEAYKKAIPNTFDIVGNVVNISIDAADFNLCGKYRVTLKYVRGNDIEIDALAFEGVQYTSLTGGTEIVGVEVVTVNISGDIGIAIPDNNKIDLNGLNSAIKRLQFDTINPVAGAQAGQVYWSDEEKTLVLNDGYHTHPIGKELGPLVKNNSGQTILNGQACYVIGSTGDNPTIGLASTANGDVAQKTIGLATMDIPNNGFGIVTTFGEVNEVNTSTLTQGSLVYLGLNGDLTTTEPASPTPKIIVGICVRQHAVVGKIFVATRPIQRLSKLSDVYTTTMANGEVLRWNSTTSRFEVFNLTTALDGKVNNTGNEGINGIKTFNSSPLMPTPTTSMQGANKGYVDSVDGTAVHKTGAETIDGVKTFNVSPIIPAPTTNLQPTTKKYVDDADTQLRADLNILNADLDKTDIKNAEQDNSIKTIEQLLSQSNLNQTAQVISTGREIVSLPKTASNGGMEVKLEGLTATNLVSGKAVAAGASVTFQTILNNKYYISTALVIAIGDGNIYTATNNTASAIDIISVNLTSTFGSGNEPDFATAKLIFSTYFEGTKSFIPTGRIRSVGKNLFNKKLEFGTILPSDGTESTSSAVLRSKFIRVKPNSRYQFTDSLNLIDNLYYYDINKKFISLASRTVFNSNNTPIQCAYIRFRTNTNDVNFSRNIQIELSLIATTYEPYKETELYLTAPELKSNGLVKDEIRKGANGYELVKRVGVGTLGANGIAGGNFEGGLIGTISSGNETPTWLINITSPITGTQDGMLRVTTIGTSGQRPMLTFQLTRTSGQYRRLSFNYKVNSGTPIIGGINIGGGLAYPLKALIGSGKYEHFYLATGSAILQMLFDGRNLFDLQIDNLKDELINVIDGASTGGEATQHGIDILYPIATPIITPIDHAGILNSAESGTVYHDPVVADAAIYGTNISILNTNYPISSLEEIMVHTNVDTYLDVSKAVIASDGLSFTHPDLRAGDLVLFTYFFNKEKVNGLITATYYDGRYVIADTANGKFYKWGVISTNGVATIQLTEV